MFNQIIAIFFEFDLSFLIYVKVDVKSVDSLSMKAIVKNVDKKIIFSNFFDF